MEWLESVSHKTDINNVVLRHHLQGHSVNDQIETKVDVDIVFKDISGLRETVTVSVRILHTIPVKVKDRVPKETLHSSIVE